MRPSLLWLSTLAAAVTASSTLPRRQLEECESGVDSRAAPDIVGSNYPSMHPQMTRRRRVPELT